MNPELDPIIKSKLEDFRSRRKNLIILRGLCSGILSFLGTFVLIALLDYLTQGRMSADLRSGLSLFGYLIVLGMVWRTCIGPLLQLPSAKKLARLLEQSSPDLKEDLLSAVELGISNDSSVDSDVFRKLVQKQASVKASKIDIKSILPLGRLKYWLRGTVTLIILTLSLLQIPDFGSDLKLLMQRAIVPGSNLPPLTLYDVRILAPDENVTRTPSNEPLRFVTLIKPKKEGLTFKEISLETKSLKESKDVLLSKRNEERFFVDYNVGNQKFEYRILVDNAPQTEWRNMDVGSRPYIKNFQKNFQYPEYSELEPLQLTEGHGDLEAWEGTTVNLALITSQPVQSGKLEFQWVEKPKEVRDLKPETEDNILQTSIRMTHPGTYRVRSLIDHKLGWEGRPSSLFEITVKPDLAPSVKWVKPTERKLLVAPNDLLSFSALAEDDLGLARIEYLIQKNKGKWQAFAIPGLIDPRGQLASAISFDLDLLLHNLKPGTQASLKLRTQDLKGLRAETEMIELSIVSRDFDLSNLHLLEKKAKVLENLDRIKTESVQMQKNFQKSLREFQQDKQNKKYFLEKSNQAENEFLVTAENTYLDSLRYLVSMPRGADSFQLSQMAQMNGQIFHTMGTTWKKNMNDLEIYDDRNQARTKSNELAKKVLSKRISMAGNFRNVAQDLLNQHSETIGVSFLNSLHKRQKELIGNLEERKPLPFISRRQEVALGQWDPIAKTFSYSRDWAKSSTLKRIKSEQLKLVESLKNGKGDRKSIQKNILEWEKTIQNILRETRQKLASKSRESFRQKSEELFWNLNRNYYLWDELGNKWKKLMNSKTDEFDKITHDLLGESDIVISETMMLSEVEQSRKDQNSLFVKDAGQTGRALIKIQQEIREIDTYQKIKFDEISKKSSELGQAFSLVQLQHHLIGTANQVLFFMRKENSKPASWKGAECARQWGRVEAIWKPILDSMYRMRISNEIVNIMKKLPNQPYRKNVIREMQNRLRNDKHIVKSMIQDADLVFKDLQQIISLLKDDILKARSFINQIAPSIPELARELAKETAQQKENIQNIQNDNNKSFSEKKEELTALKLEQEEIGNSIENFAQALRQEANIQNLLDDEGREIARDSDDAAALVEETEVEIEDNFKKVTESNDSEEIESLSEETIASQEELIEELNLIADHFEKLKDQESVAETRAELRELEENLEISEKIEEQYAQAERLADLAKLAPEELLNELEEELEQNQAMQRELSDLAQETAEDAKEQLKEALTEEEALIDKLEKENKGIQEEKQKLAKELEKLARETQKLAEQKIEPLKKEAEKAEIEKVEDKSNELIDSLIEEALKVEDVAKKKPDTQKLKDSAMELAESLNQTSEELNELAKELEKQAEHTPESAQAEADELEEVAQKAEKFADSLQENTDQKKEEAQQAKQESLRKEMEAEKKKENLNKASQELAKAEEIASELPDDPNNRQNLEDSKKEFDEELEAFKNAEEERKEAEIKADNLEELAKQSEAASNKATQEAQEKREQAEQAKKIADAFTNEEDQELISQASENGSELASEAALQAQDLQQRAEEIAEALDQLTENAEGNEELLSEALQKQNELAEDIFETSQDLARAARHEERLDNEEVSNLLDDLAENSKETALNEIPETGQAIENQALANELENLAEAAQNLAGELEETNPQGDQGIADQLTASAEQAENVLEDQPSFSELKKETETFTEQANLAEEQLEQLAQSLGTEAKAAQEKADDSTSDANQAKTKMEQALEDAKHAEELAQQLDSAANKATQEMETGNATQQDVKDAVEAAENAAEEAAQLSSLAEKASEDFEDIREQATLDQQAAETAMQESKQAAEQAESAANLANSAEKLLEEFSNPFSSELTDSQLPGAVMSLNEVGDSLEQQLDALEQLQSGQPLNSNNLTSNPDVEKESSFDNSSSDPANPTTEESGYSENPFPINTPFSDPEVSEVLAQTLDSLDQAIFENENPFSQTSEPTSEFENSKQVPQSEQTPNEPSGGEPTSEANLPGNSSEEPGEQVPGSGPGTGGLTSFSSIANPSDAMAMALQSLQLATEAHAQAMSQKRTNIMMSDGKGNQLNSMDNQYQVTPVAEVGELPKYEEQNEEDWGKLPPKLAKDLMEAKRENVSENYRSQVQAYFQAMSKKARTIKK